MREPSLHIKENDLAKIIGEIRYTYKINKLSDRKFAKEILKLAKGISCNSRSINVTNNKTKDKVDKVLRSDKADSLLLSDIIFIARKKLKHRGITKINQDHKDWPQLKKLSQCCIQFCNEFELSRRKGFIEYINIGMSKINSTRSYIGKLINMQESISNEYEVKILISQDTDSQTTKDIHDLYTSLIMKNTNISINYINQPLKYIKFKEVNDLTKELNIPYDIYLKAQFEGLLWADSYPEPAQLIGDRAIERLNKYMYEKKIKVKDNKEKAKFINPLLKIKENEQKNNNRDH